MNFDSDITKLQEQIDLLKKQKEEKEQNKINMTTYLDNFVSITQIDDEIKLLYNYIYTYKNLLLNANLHKNNLIPSFTGDPKILINIDVLNIFDKIKDLVINYYESMKNNYKPSSIFQLQKSNNDCIIFDNILRLVFIIVSNKNSESIDKRYSLLKELNFRCINSFEKKYQNYYNDKDNDKDNDYITELDEDLRIIKMYYLETIIYIKQQQKLLSGYPDNFDKICQLKIIELQKKKLNLINFL